MLLSRQLTTIHLVYLGLLPALATFACLAQYGHPAAFLLFLAGTAVVSVYLAVTVSYVPAPRSAGVALVTLVDGPILALLFTSAAGSLDIFTFAINSFLIDGTAIWLVIGLLAAATDRPTTDQRTVSVGLVLIAIVTMVSLVGPYLRDGIWGHWTHVLWLLVGIGEAVLAYYVLLYEDEVVRDADTTMKYLIVFIFVWLIALFAGIAVHAQRARRWPSHLIART